MRRLPSGYMSDNPAHVTTFATLPHDRVCDVRVWQNGPELLANFEPECVEFVRWHQITSVVNPPDVN